MKRFQSISENLSYNDILQLDGAFSALHINYGKSPLFNGENSKDLAKNSRKNSAHQQNDVIILPAGYLKGCNIPLFLLCG